MRRFVPVVSELEGLRNLGPKSAAWLAEVDITTRTELARIGAIGACRRLRHAGHPVTRNMAYAIEGALMDCDWRAIPFEFRKQLALDFSALNHEAYNLQGHRPPASISAASKAQQNTRRAEMKSRASVHMATKHRIFATSFASVYPLYVTKAEKKGRKKSEVDAVIRWLTGYSQQELAGQLKKQNDFETFFKEAPKLNPSRTLIRGVICGVRVEDIQEPTMREIRYLDKLVDELAKGWAMEKILRTDA